MGRPAARKGDFHVCPRWTGKVPHVGGPILQGSPKTLVNNRPAARVGDLAFCIGPVDRVATGSSTVLIDNRRAARFGDRSAHGGWIVQGSGTVIIG
jgi:uncharacterized Zn-binding protein involved in type VI secretion